MTDVKTPPHPADARPSDALRVGDLGAGGPGTDSVWIGLRMKLILLIVLCFATTFAAITLVELREKSRTASAISIRNGLTKAALLAGQMDGGVRFRDGERLVALAETAADQSQGELNMLIVRGRDGETLAQFAATSVEAAELSSVSTLEKLAARAIESGTAESAAEQAHVLTAVPIRVKGKADGEIVGAVAVEWDVADTLAAIDGMIRDVLTISGAVSLAGLALAVLVISWMVTGPLRRVSTAMARVAHHDYDVEIPYGTRRDELGAMSRRLGGFRDRLAAEERDRNERAEAERRKREADDRVRELFDRLARSLANVARGSLAERIEVDDLPGLDRHSLLVCENYNRLIGALAALMGAVEESAEIVRMNSREISQVAQDMSERSENQAVALEESAAALEDLTGSVRETARNAGEARKQIGANREQAEANRDVVSDTVAAMRKIEESSSQITAIISVIDDIAFQTNLLALNAGVEAARAGEAGRGFAVVASEVRALAQRASDSAGEIKELIVRSEAHVEEGGRLVGQTGDALAVIIDGVAKSSDLVARIAEASHEQSESLSEINAGITELDKVTQQNAAVIEETSASSRALGREAESLAQVIASFRAGSATGVTRADSADRAESTGEGNPIAVRVPSIAPVRKPDRKPGPKATRPVTLAMASASEPEGDRVLRTPRDAGWGLHAAAAPAETEAPRVSKAISAVDGSAALTIGTGDEGWDDF